MQKKEQNSPHVATRPEELARFCLFIYIAATVSSTFLFLVSLANPYNNVLDGYTFAGALGLWFVALFSGAFEWNYSKRASVIMLVALLLLTVVGVLRWMFVLQGID